ncbi:hydroxymethylglutaryl-CoA lyase [Anaerosphaera aminiphila DSM 21120]|uniref:Hydroxymethylglutaryl-CoA lyase n=1 Tax=Anaerosphaera aminiphila DSM 21120 TaxID=1120995 RepID=A0A1M5U8F8_9FIRM|nr:hydroxymethylglutaryl-CoA lyase [Anaerosphaera aminiphila]SHH58963.1 hydroxymethylglutaryl-CoA lyase [Anaerosphaera aminiphila DSM 21120]
MGGKVKIVEVGPRDGFQSIKNFIPTEIKLNAIDKIINSGLNKIQITSFVSPKAIPQMKDSRELAEECLERYPNVELFALVPNLYGAKTAMEVGLKEVSIVVSLSETHNRANVNKSIEDSINEIDNILQSCSELSITVDIATAFGCPFEGEMQVEDLLKLIEKIGKLGINSFTICDTIGIAYPSQVKNIFESIKKEFPNMRFGAHIHDTRNMGILNSYIAIKNGVNSVQSSIGGLGGCPFAPGASGNTSSEDLVYALNKDGYDTGINFDVLLDAAKYTKENIVGNYSGHHINIENSKFIMGKIKYIK